MGKSDETPSLVEGFLFILQSKIPIAELAMEAKKPCGFVTIIGWWVDLLV